MCLLVYCVCSLLLISSALILCFIAAEGVQNVHVAAAAALCAHILACPGCQVSPTMLMRSKFNGSSPPSQTLRNTHTYWRVLCCRKRHRRRRVTFISTLYHFILPPLHPSHRFICLSSPVIFIPLSHPCFISPFFPFTSPPPSVSHYLLLLSLLSSQSNTSLVLSNFPCPWCFFSFYHLLSPLSSFRALTPFFTSTPLLTPHFCHSLLITHLHPLYFVSLFFFYSPPLLLCPSLPPYPSVSSLIFHPNPFISFYDSLVFYLPPLLFIPSTVTVSLAFLSMHLTFLTYTLIPSTTVLCRGRKMWLLSLAKL